MPLRLDTYKYGKEKMTGKTDNKSENRRKLPDSVLWLLIVLNALLFLLFLVIAAYTFYAVIFSDRAVDSPAFQSGLLAKLLIALVVFGFPVALLNAVAERWQYGRLKLSTILPLAASSLLLAAYIGLIIAN